MRLYKLPSMYVFGIFGTFGAGKTLFLLENGLDFACYYRKQIAATFYLDVPAIRRFGRKYNKRWLSICRIKHSLSVEALFQCNNSILLLDEAGLELFARNWKNRTRLELDALLRIRHYKNKLLYVAQKFDDVDVKFRNHTQLICWIRGFQLPTDPPELICRFAIFFDRDKFQIFLEKHSNEAKIVYPLKLAGFRYQFDWVRWRDYYQDLFRLYDSFDADRSRFVQESMFEKRSHQFLDGDLVDWKSKIPQILKDSRKSKNVRKVIEFPKSNFDDKSFWELK